MPAGCPAFTIGERIRFAPIAQIEKIEEQMREQQQKIEAGELPFGICEIFEDGMAAHSGKEATIKAISMYHFGIPIYEFDELSGNWPEEVLCDPQLDQAAEDVISEPANLHYSVHYEVCGEHKGVVQIRGLEDGETYCSLRKLNPEWIANSIRKITEKRSRHAFETLFMFDGNYGVPEVGEQGGETDG